MKKLLSTALALVMAFGSVTVLPQSGENGSGFAITSEAAISTDFVVEEVDGVKWIVKYKGNGGNVKIPGGCNVASSVFYANKSIRSVTFEGPCNIGEEAFAHCYNLETVVAKSAVKINNDAFYWCVNLKTVDLKGGVNTKIGKNAFEICQNLEEVKIAKGKYKFIIDEAAFNKCVSLKSIEIPSTCKSIYDYAFLNCHSLTEIVVPKDTSFEKTKNGYHVGYFSAAYTAEDLEKGVEHISINNGKDSIYMYVYSNKGTGVSVGYGLVADEKRFTPKKTTMIVTKGSDAEKYAKEYKVEYKYPSSKLPAPTDITYSSTKTKITLKWKAVEGADAYRVYIYDTKTGKYKQYKTVKSATCSISGLKKGKTYKFRVMSLDSINGKYKSGGTSKAVSVKTAS